MRESDTFCFGVTTDQIWSHQIISSVYVLRDALWSFLFVQRIIPIKKELMKYKLASDDKCPVCLNPHSIEHTFIHCQESTDFFTKTLGWFHYFHKTKIKLSNRKILFNRYVWRLLLNSIVLKMAANFIKYVWRLTSFYFDACFFFFFLLVWTMSNSYKIHFVTLLFFIDRCKWMFTTYFVLFPIKFCLSKKCLRAVLWSCFQVVTMN